MSDKQTVNIHGKEYETVASRVQRFREQYPQYTLRTDILFRDETEVVMQASILNEEGRVIATGHAEEKRQASTINRTSALENCETSAIGRALAAFGIGGTEFASADEVGNAIKQQSVPSNPKPTTKPADTQATPLQKRQIKALLTGMGIPDEEMAKFLEDEFGVIPGTPMLKVDAVKIITELEGGESEAAA